jgi:hypothetical protein
MKKRTICRFCYSLIFLIILFSASAHGFKLTAGLQCNDIGKSDSSSLAILNSVIGLDLYDWSDVPVTIPINYSCEGDYYGMWLLDHSDPFKIYNGTAGPTKLFTVNYDANPNDCTNYGLSVGRHVVNTTYGCCGDDMPGDKGSDPADNPDLTEEFCEGSPFDESDWGCPIGRFSESDPKADQNNFDTNKRAWQFDLGSISGVGPVGCCGDDYGDEGVTALNTVKNSYSICDNSSDGMMWRSADASQIGAVYHINTSVGSLNPEKPGWNISKADYYDVVGTEAGTWAACDTDNTLTAAYAKSDSFPSQQYCEGSSGPKCMSIKDSEFMCYPGVSQEKILECRDIATNAKNFKAAAPNQEANRNDEDTGYVIGKMIPNPFSETFSEFNRVPKTPCASDFCLIFPGNANLMPNADFSLRPGIKPVMSNWQGYYALAFDIYFKNPQNRTLLYVKINNLNVNLQDYIVGNEGNWFHVVVPLSGVSNLNSITTFSLFPTGFIGDAELSNFYLEGPSSFYCGRGAPIGGEWRKDLDTDTTTTDASHPTGGQACDAQLTMSWTGSRCCGDDYTSANSGYHSEFYTDVEGNCWNGHYLSTAGDVYSINNRSSILSFTNKFYSCFAPENLQSIKSTITANTILEKADFCTAKGNYYCSYQGMQWSNLGYNNGVVDRTASQRTSKKFNPEGNTADCCHPSDCWNGTSCVASQEQITMGLPIGVEAGRVTVETSGNYTGFRCINGSWTQSDVKWDWLDQQWGYCGKKSDCLLSSSRCAADGFMSFRKVIDGRDVSDLSCENGSWSTRTKKLAQEMLNIKSDNYVLDCGPYFQVLNFYSQRTAFQPTLTFENIVAGKELNNVCVLSYGGSIVVGTTYNPEEGTELKYVLSNAFNIRNFSVTTCAGNLNDGKFHNCGSGIWYNDVTKSVIYDYQNKIDLDGNIFTNFFSYMIGSIRGLFGMPIPVTAGEKALLFANRTQQFNNLYVSKHGGKEIKAVVEKKYIPGVRPGVKQLLTATYSGFSQSICSSVLNYDWFVANRIPNAYSRDVICNETNGKEVVVAIDDAVGAEAFNNLLADITRRTRAD